MREAEALAVTRRFRKPPTEKKAARKAKVAAAKAARKAQIQVTKAKALASKAAEEAKAAKAKAKLVRDSCNPNAGVVTRARLARARAEAAKDT